MKIKGININDLSLFLADMCVTYGIARDDRYYAMLERSGINTKEMGFSIILSFKSDVCEPNKEFIEALIKIMNELFDKEEK